jgi:4-amino-4-deoxy-L-arabinose transferase-like glycosyltransferase
MNTGSTQVLDQSTIFGESKLRRAFHSGRFANIVYGLAIGASILVWLLAIRAPLGMDETGSYWQISAGVSPIWPRQFMGLGFPAYPYILWFFTKCIGNSEMALRIPSVLAMLGAALLLYRAAREFFDEEISLVATVLFCINPIVVFEAIDIRPYAFAVLVTNAAILVLLRLRASKSVLLAGLFGFLAAFILYFHHLFAVILPVFLVCFIAFAFQKGKAGWKQLGIALAVFCVTFMPLIPGLKYLFRTAQAHVYETAPDLGQLLWTLAPGWIIPGILFAALVAWTQGGRWEQHSSSFWIKLLICASLGLIPALLLFGISAGTSIHMFAIRHRMVAVPGISLVWAVAVGCIPQRVARALLCAVLVTVSVVFALMSPHAGVHTVSWKYALQAAEKNASVDHAPVVMCSTFVESDYAAMPVADPAASIFFAPITYYKLTSPVIPLPADFTPETVRVASGFLKQAAAKRQRFLLLAHTDNPVLPNTSYPTVQWMEKNTSETYNVRWLGIFDGIAVLEFVPRNH